MEGNGHAVKSPLTREAILAVMDMKMELADVPEWGGAVFVKNLSGRARDKFEASRYRLHGKDVEMIHDNTRATLLALTLCDEHGSLLFSESDIVALGEKNAEVLDRLFDVAQRLSGLNKTLEDRTKNSGTTQN